jgi:hypothetical protein
MSMPARDELRSPAETLTPESVADLTRWVQEAVAQLWPSITTVAEALIRTSDHWIRGSEMRVLIGDQLKDNPLAPLPAIVPQGGEAGPGNL